MIHNKYICDINSFIASLYSSIEFSPYKDTSYNSVRAVPGGCIWLSTNPGNNILFFASIIIFYNIYYLYL